MMRDSVSECSCCGSEERWFIHNIKHRGSLSRVCTSCVLKLYPGLFCPHCFEVYEGSVEERVVCTKCSSVSHSACVGLENANQYVCPTCLDPSFLFFHVGASNMKSKDSNGESVSGSRIAMDDKMAKVFLSATQIAASSMAKAAAAARVEAEKRVKEAAFARKRAKEALEWAAAVTAQEGRKGKGLMVNPAHAPEQNKKAKGSTGVAAAVAAQKPIQKNLRVDGKGKYGGIPTPAMNRASTKGHPKKNISINDNNNLREPFALNAPRQQVQNPLPVSTNEDSSDFFNSHNHVRVKEENNGVLPDSSVAGQLQHANSQGKEDHRGKSGRLIDSETGSQQLQSKKDILGSTTNSGVLLIKSSDTAS